MPRLLVSENMIFQNLQFGDSPKLNRLVWKTPFQTSERSERSLLLPHFGYFLYDLLRENLWGKVIALLAITLMEGIWCARKQNGCLYKCPSNKSLGAPQTNPWGALKENGPCCQGNAYLQFRSDAFGAFSDFHSPENIAVVNQSNYSSKMKKSGGMASQATPHLARPPTRRRIAYHLVVRFG